MRLGLGRRRPPAIKSPLKISGLTAAELVRASVG